MEILEQENKYYKPESHEFRIGFRYEIELRSREWIEYTYPKVPRAGVEWGATPHHMIPLKFGDHCRVKHLDREDIESLGFKLSIHVVPIFKLRGKPPMSFTNIENGSIEVFELDLHEDGNINISCIYCEVDLGCVFSGKVKNKSELSIILKQVGMS